MTVRPLASAASVLAVVTLAACGSSGSSSSTTSAVAATTTTSTTTTPTTTTPLPGTGKPPVVIGDKNYTEQFVLGELYYQALKAQGFTVQINQNIGPNQVRLTQLQRGDIAMYPEYLNVWNSQIAGDTRRFSTVGAAYAAARRYALAHGVQLLNYTRFSDTGGIAVTAYFAQQNRLRTIADLGHVAMPLTLGGPPGPEFQADRVAGLPALERAYHFTTQAYSSLEIGQPSYMALDQGMVQAAYVDTSDGEFTTGDYTLLGDPKNVLGIGNVVPVVTAKALAAEGPDFAATINQVSALLTLPVIRELNAEVDPDLAGKSAAGVASRFLADHGLIPPNSVITS